MTTRAVVRTILATGVVAGCLGWALPRLSGVPWSATLATVASVPVPVLAGLTLLWISGLLVHSIALAAAMPGLTVRRALTLSLTGSSIANLLPVGGAAGIALNYSMVRTWGFRRSDFAVYTAVSNAWIVAAKLLTPVVAAVALLALPVPHTSAVGPLLLVTGIGVAALAAAVGVVLLVARRRAMAEVLAGARRVVARGWPRLTAATLAYTALLAALLWASLTVTGTVLGLGALLLVVAVERTSTLANLTPGGLGVVELGVVGALVAIGTPAPAAVAGVLLYRAFTFALEIPVGGAWLLGWWASRRWSVRTGRAVVA